jgi:hypothetical protein
MTILVPISRTPRLAIRAFSTTWNSKLSGYHKMLQSSDREKVRKIAETFLQKEDRIHFNSTETRVSGRELVSLVQMVEAITKIPMTYLDIPRHQDEAIHFQTNRTFINLPYSEQVSTWPDRNALQSLIRDHFRLLFEPGDLVLVPGCADGQIPIEIQANGIQHEIDLDMIAADFNETAMKLGYCTMKSYGLNPDRIQWVRGDVTSASFFDWITPRSLPKSRHQIVTLIQPSLRETSLLTFLERSAELAHKSHNPTTIVMPFLLEDHETMWYKNYETMITKALIQAEKTNDLPQLVWNKTKFGKEVLKLNTTKNAYVPQQYFVIPEAIPEIQKIKGYSEAAQKIFGILQHPETYGYPGDPRLIVSDYSKRVYCIWNVK